MFMDYNKLKKNVHGQTAQKKIIKSINLKSVQIAKKWLIAAENTKNFIGCNINMSVPS